MIRVLVVDDHPVVREGLSSGLPDDDIEVVGAAATVEEALELSLRLQPDVILLDLELRSSSGLDLIPTLRESTGSAILVLTAYEIEEQVMGALRGGARGYLLKGASLRDIREAARAVQRGESVLDPRIASKVVGGLQRDRIPSLTKREREVLSALISGSANKEIATALGISERTVKFHVTSILSKLGAENRTEAVSIAVRQKLI